VMHRFLGITPAETFNILHTSLSSPMPPVTRTVLAAINRGPALDRSLTFALGDVAGKPSKTDLTFTM
jgi:hypothetical protein